MQSQPFLIASQPLTELSLSFVSEAYLSNWNTRRFERFAVVTPEYPEVSQRVCSALLIYT